MKILIEESVLRQALEALDDMAEYSPSRLETQRTALRTVLDAAEKVEPAIDPNCRCDEYGACAYCWNGKKHDTIDALAKLGADKEE